MTHQQVSEYIYNTITHNIENGPTKFNFRSEQLCQKDWCRVHGISVGKFRASMGHKPKSHVNIDTSIEQPTFLSRNAERCRAWIDAQLRTMCDQMPHENNVWRLPQGLTITSLHDMYVTEFRSRPPDPETGQALHTFKYAEFNKILRTQFPNVKHHKHKGLSQCDVCASFKDPSTSKLLAEDYMLK